MFVLLSLAPALGFAWSPFPVPTGRIAISPEVSGDYALVQGCLANLNSAVGASYAATVVPITDAQSRPTPDANDAVPFVDHAYSQWSALDPDTHILIALGLRNRAVAVHPGTNWVKIGFERDEITKTIDSSSFKTHARADDYPTAICVLAKAIDARLVQLTDAAGETRQHARATIAEVEQQLSGVSALADRLAAAPTDAGIEEELAKVRPALDEAKALVDDYPVHASRAAQRAQSHYKRATWLLESYEKHNRAVPGWKRAIAEQRTKASQHPDSEAYWLQEALRTLDQCDNEYLKFSPSARIWSVDDCLRRANDYLEIADRNYFLKWRVLPGVVGGLLIAGLLAGFVRLTRRRRRFRALVDAELAHWSKSLGTASERLLDLETEFSMYFDAARPAWVGASAELDQVTADEVNRLFLTFSKAQDIAKEARTAADEVSLFRSATLLEVVNDLREAEVVIETGEKETKRRIFLPLSREYRATAAELLNELGGAYERASSLLQQTTEVLNVVDEARTTARGHRDVMSASIDARQQLGYPVAKLQLHFDAANAEFDRGRELADTDPRTASTIFAEASAQFIDGTRLADLGNRAVEFATSVAGQLDALKERVQQLRADGYVVREAGFDPDAENNRLAQVASAVLKLVDAMDSEAADDLANRLREDLARFERAIDRTETARVGVPQKIEELTALRAENEQRTPDAQKILAELEAHHALTAFTEESDNIEEIAHLRVLAEQGFAAARVAHAEQRYLAAWSDVETLERLLDEQRVRLDELVTILQRLDEARDTSQKELAEVDRRLGEIATLRARAVGIGREAAEAAERYAADAESVRAAMQQERPDWLCNATATAELLARVTAVQTQMQQEVVDYRIAIDEHTRLSTEAKELLARAEAEHRDRYHVEAAIHAAIGALELASNAIQTSDVGGIVLRKQVAEAGENLKVAEKIWNTELSLIQTAISEVDAMNRLATSVRGAVFSYSIAADTSNADELLTAAAAAFKAKKYEDAVKFSAEASTRLRTARLVAEQAVASRRAAEAAAAAARAASSSSSSSSYSRSSSYSSSSFSSRSGGSSWGSSSGGSSW